MELNEDLKLCLLAGLPLKVEGVGEIRQLILKEIIKMGYSKYNYYLSILLNIKNLINDSEIDLSKISDFEMSLLLSHYNENFRDDFLKSLSCFFDEPVFFHKDGFYYLSDIKEQKFILDKNFGDIQNKIRQINCIKIEKEPEYNPANKEAEDFIKELQRKKKLYRNTKKNNDVDLYSMISGLSWKANDINIINVWDLTIYQLYDALSRLDLIDHYENTLHGIFAGTIDSKKTNLKNINWMKVIKQ